MPVITSPEELGRRGLRDPRMRALLDRGGWYLVGSRAAGFDDELSDWDTLVLSSVEADRDILIDADDIFGVARPVTCRTPTLELHRQWRAAGAVDVTLLGPSACEQRATDRPAEWAFELHRAIPLSPLNEAAERYRRDVAGRFRRAQPQLTLDAYAAFRLARNEAVATLPRADEAGQAMNAAICVRQAARFWLLAAGRPYPTSKWLLAELQRHADVSVLTTMSRAVDLRLSPSERFTALWNLWEAVDAHARKRGIDPRGRFRRSTRIAPPRPT